MDYLILIYKKYENPAENCSSSGLQSKVAADATISSFTKFSSNTIIKLPENRERTKFMELSDRIKEERNKLNLSQDALANKLHVSRQAISKWEIGQSYPDLEKLIQLSDIFEITLDELVKGDKKLERKLIKDGGNLTTRLPIFGYVLIVLGVMTVFWGGSKFPVNLMSEDFMSFLTSASVLIMLGVLLIKDIPKWIVIGALYLTLLVSVVYMVSLKMDLWVLLMSIVVVIGFGWWLTTKITDKNLKGNSR